ncbi:MAG: O-antigen ligase family protein [Nitrospirota bacterium]
MQLRDKIERFIPSISAVETLLKQMVRIAVIVLFAYYAGQFMGSIILINRYLVPVVIFIGFLFVLLSSAKQKFYLLSTAVFLPLMFPRFFVREVKWIELLSLLFGFLMILDLMIKREKLFDRRIKIYYVAIGIISIWSLIHFAQNPVLGGFFGESISQGGIRSYFAIFVGISLFFYSFWYFRDRLAETDKLLNYLMFLALFFGYLRLAGYFLQFNIPFFGGNFDFNGDLYKDFTRIGGLMEMSVLGIAVCLTLYSKNNWGVKHITLLVLFLILLFFSGARGGFMGVLLMFLVYLTFISSRYFMPLTILLVLFAGSYVMFLQNAELPGQVKRLTALEGGIKKQDKYRKQAYETLMERFMENPVFGKGIGISGELSGGAMSALVQEDEAMQQGKTKKDENEPAKELQMKSSRISKEDLQKLAGFRGGHGSYMSIIGLYGIGGLIYFLIMLYGSIYFAFKVFRGHSAFDREAKLALFAFLYLTARTLIYIPEGTGYDSMELWFIAGMVAALRVRYGIGDEVEA